MTLSALIIGFYALTLALLSLYGLHRWWMAAVFLRHRRESPRPGPRPASTVTVQLPLFNEQDVAERLIDAAAAIDCRSVESGGTAAASARMRKLEARKPTLSISMRKPVAGMIAESDFVCSTETETVLDWVAALVSVSSCDRLTVG